MIVVVLVVALVLAYFWLAGHWFGRAVAFVLLGCGLSFLSVAFFEGKPWALLPFLGVWVPAWFIAGLPSAYWNKKAREGWQVVG